MSSDLVTFRDVNFNVIDASGEKWVTVKQLSQALGYSHQDQLNKLFRRNHLEFQRKLYTVNLTGKQGRPETIINYHGVIRAAMLANTKEALEFRDWAEEVLFKVMTTGHYGGVDNFQKLAENLLELSAIHQDAMNSMVRRLDILESRPTLIASSQQIDITTWMTAGNYIRLILRPKNIPKRFNSGAAFDLFAANEHNRLHGTYPHPRSRWDYGKPGYVYPPGAETSVFLRTAYDKYLKGHNVSQRQLALRVATGATGHD